MFVARFACLSAAFALAVPLGFVDLPPVAAQAVDKDGKPVGHGQKPATQQQHQNVQPKVQQPVQQPIQKQARPATNVPQRADPAAAVRREQFERGRPPERRDTGERRFEGGRTYGGAASGDRRFDGDRRRDANRFGQRRRFGLGAGIVIIGGLLGYELYRGSDRDDVFRRCDRNFPDFDYETGSFVNEDGDREICPYLVD